MELWLYLWNSLCQRRGGTLAIFMAFSVCAREKDWKAIHVFLSFQFTLNSTVVFEQKPQMQL